MFWHGSLRDSSETYTVPAETIHLMVPPSTSLQKAMQNSRWHHCRDVLFFFRLLDHWEVGWTAGTD